MTLDAIHLDRIGWWVQLLPLPPSVIGAGASRHETVGQWRTDMTNGTSGATVRLSYLKIRDVTTKDEEANGASTYVVVLPAAEILKIGTDGNLRSYIPAHEGKKRNLVHKAIAKTIRENSDRFSQLNSGFLIGASKINVDDNKKVVTLRHASVNNGAQSQGEIKLY